MSTVQEVIDGLSDNELCQNYIALYMKRPDGLPGWYFIDEIAAEHGPFATQHDALVSLKHYIAELG